MPNWCKNELDISGEPATVQKFYNEFKKSGKFEMDNIYPMPQIFKDYDTTNNPDNYKEICDQQLAEYGVIGWYDWHVKYWGTNWDIQEVVVVNEDLKHGVVSLEYYTAWSPNIEFFEYVAKEYPTLCVKLRYIEPYMFYAGKWEYDGDGSIFNDDGEPVYVSIEDGKVIELDENGEFPSEFCDENGYLDFGLATIVNPFY